jgi:hypothetical protein
MPNIRMLTAQRELTEKERVKNQGTLKAQRSQEMDTQDVAKKTNTSEAARAFKKAQSDLRSAKAEEQLAETKAKYAAIGAAIGAIGTIVSIGAAAVTLGKGSKDEKPGEGAKPKDTAKKSDKAVGGASKPPPASKPDNKPGDASKPKDQNPSKPEDVAKPKEAERPDAASEKEKPKAEKSDGDKAKETQDKAKDNANKGTDSGGQQIESAVVSSSSSVPGGAGKKKTMEEQVNELNEKGGLGVLEVASGVASNVSSSINTTDNPNAKPGEKPVAEQKIEGKPVAEQKTEGKPVAEQKTEGKPVAEQTPEGKPATEQTPEGKPVAEQKPADQPQGGTPPKEADPNAPATNAFGATQAQVAQANQIKQLLEGITDLGGMEKSKLSSIDWNKGGGNNEFKVKDPNEGSAMETFLTAFKGPKALEQLGNRNAMAKSRTELGGFVKDATAKTEGIAKAAALLDRAEAKPAASDTNKPSTAQASLEPQFSKDEMGVLQSLGVADSNGKIDPDKIAAARGQLSSELAIITGVQTSTQPVSSTDLKSQVESAQSQVKAISDALNGNDPIAFARVADPEYFNKDSKRSPLEAVQNAVGGRSGRQGIVDNLGGTTSNPAANLPKTGILGQIQTRMNDNFNNDSVRSGGRRNGNALFEKFFGNDKSRLSETFSQLKQAEISRNPAMKSLFASGAVELGKDGNLKVKSDSLFSSSSNEALAQGVVANRNRDGKPVLNSGGNQPIDTQNVLATASSTEKATVLATLSQNGANKEVARILKTMSPSERSEIFNAKGADGNFLLDRAEVIGKGVKNGSISLSEAREMLFDPKAQTDERQQLATAIDQASRGGDVSKADKSLLESVKGSDGKVDQNKLANLTTEQQSRVNTLLSGAQGQIDLNGTRDMLRSRAVAEVARMNGSDDVALSGLLDSKGNLTEQGQKVYDSLTPENQQRVNNISLLQRGSSDFTQLSPAEQTEFNKMVNIGATNSAFRDAVAKDPSLKSLQDNNGNLKSEYFDDSGNLSQNLSVTDSNGNDIGGSKINAENQLKAVENAITSGSTQNLSKETKGLVDEFKASAAGDTLNRMLDSGDENTQKVGARLFKDLSPEQKASLSNFDKSKLGGAKEVEKPTGFNAFMMYMNVGMPGIQFMLQQLDKMREAEEQKQEATKKKNAANKLMEK